MSEPVDLSQVISLLQQSSDTLDDDTCRFSIYSATNQVPSIQAELESYWGPKHFTHSSTKTQFIWHSGHPPDLKSIAPSQLDGTLHYGISLQDEWFLVWCLFEISKAFDCQIQVHDNDGEFLLIEAADHLPKWLTPDSAKGRVWIQEGSIYLIPLEATPSIQTDLPTSLALQILRTKSHSAVASSSINSTILDRIHRASPQVLTESHLFNTEAYLHINIAKSLQADPNLIGLAVKAFCEKDVDSFKACRDMIRFPPPQPPHNPKTEKPSNTSWPYRLIRMTRPLYAILLNHELTFHPPKPFEKVGWMDVDRENSGEWKRRLVGMKVSCGFEMMLSTLHSGRTTCDPLFNGHSRRYQTYLDKLQKAGYFQDEVPGSTKWVELESIAKKPYLDSLKTNDFATRFDFAIAQSHISDDSIDSLESQGESDEWMDLDEEQLKALLKDGNQPNPASLESHEQQSDAEMNKMRSFANLMEKFVDGQGSLEGAVHSDDEMTDESEDTSGEDEDSEQEELRADIFPRKNKGTKRAFQGPNPHSTGKYDEEATKRLAILVPGLADAEWGQSSQKPTETAPDRHPKPSESSLDHPPKLTESSTDTLPSFFDDSKRVETPNTTSASPQNKKPLPRLAKQSYDGVCEDSSEDDSDSDDLNTPSGMEKQANAQVVEDIDMDGERDDFLKFAQEALGLTAGQYEAILDSRRKRGAYVPPSTSKVSQDDTSAKQTADMDFELDSSRHSNDLKARSSVSKGKQPQRSVHFEADNTTEEDAHRPTSSVDADGERIEDKRANVDLDTFDKLMNRMDEELQKKKRQRGVKKGGPIPTDPLGPDLGGGCGPGMDDGSDDDEDESDMEMGEIDHAIQGELADLMKESGVQLDGHSHDQPDYSVISNFLESFKSQVGLPGPVGNMAGRIGFEFLPSKDKKP
ncbi:hypothetical protein PCANC_27242 [Puccinia coronata f. sp. avenae]|uniref:SGT1-domain-containing protein n=1 Tax=Puccinia coronata f. sp. avenae TaxID=200324 RepID=A0A2N5TGA7_9BASI|nr:hypothetical protein PCANC_27242 [Puccinia coronata f. sp. avenae]